MPIEAKKKEKIFKFRLVYKITLLVMIFTLTPIIIFSFITLGNINDTNIFISTGVSQLNSQTEKLSINTLTNNGSELVKQKAVDVGNQVRIYMKSHPEINIRDSNFNNNEELKKIAVQPVGISGYTAVQDIYGINRFHVNSEQIGLDLSTLADKFPGFWSILKGGLSSSSSGYYDWQDADGKVRKKFMYCQPIKETELAICATTYIDEFLQPIEELKKVVTASSKNLIDSNNRIYANTKKFLMIIIAGFFILTMFSSFFFLRTITSSLVSLKNAAKRISEGDLETEINVKTEDEVGELAATFNIMSAELKSSRKKLEDYNKVLEKEVNKKTFELEELLIKEQQGSKNLESQRQAILNILEDVSDSEEKLKEMNISLERKGDELTLLKNLSDDLTNILDVDESVKTINKYLNQVFDFTTATYLIINPFDERGIIYKSFLNKSVSEQYIAEVKNNLIGFLDHSDNTYSASVLSILKNINPQISGSKLDNKNLVKIDKNIFLPLQMGESKLGVIYLSLDNKKAFKPESEPLIEAMVVSFSISVNHLYTLISTQHSKTISLVESLSDGVIMFNNNKDVILINPAVSKYTGFSKEYFNFNDFYKLFAHINFNNMIDESIKNGKTEHINEVQILNKFYEVIVAPVKDSQKKIVGGAIIIHDITHIKQVDRMKTEFVSVASHQLRTPLTAIKLFTEMLIKEQVGKLGKDQKDYLDNIYQSTDRMVRLVNDLLNVTRIESGRLKVDPQPTDLFDFIKKIIAEAAPIAAAKGIKIKFNPLEKTLPEIPIDRNLIQQVIHNLLINAVRYTPIGKNEVEISLGKDGENYLISVSDKGIGIPVEAQSRIFEKFFRADNAVKIETEGTGLGLYVCKMIIESSGGKIWFESIKSKGTTFFMTLPIKGMVKKEGERGLAIS